MRIMEGTTLSTILEAKQALDKVIGKARVHLYKPIQIAEILHRKRVIDPDLELENLDSYRVESRKWRRNVTSRLLGRDSSSSARYQDDVFNDNAIPPSVLKVLGDANQATGVVEAYIYARVHERYKSMRNVLAYAETSDPRSFHLKELLRRFREEPGLKRSQDKVYEIAVHALFDSLVRALCAQVTVAIDETKKGLAEEFRSFIELVLGLSPPNLAVTMPARLFRAGVTNAADRGLDMWSNFGPAVQVKHVTLDKELLEEIVESVAADRVVVVCRDCDRDQIEAVVRQLWSNRVQGIITESDLDEWYERALRGKYAGELAEGLLRNLREGLRDEFPLMIELETFLEERGYNKIPLTGIWQIEQGD